MNQQQYCIVRMDFKTQEFLYETDDNKLSADKAIAFGTSDKKLLDRIVKKRNRACAKLKSPKRWSVVPLTPS